MVVAAISSSKEQWRRLSREGSSLVGLEQKTKARQCPGLFKGFRHWLGGRLGQSTSAGPIHSGMPGAWEEGGRGFQQRPWRKALSDTGAIQSQHPCSRSRARCGAYRHLDWRSSQPVHLLHESLCRHCWHIALPTQESEDLLTSGKLSPLYLRRSPWPTEEGSSSYTTTPE